MSASEEQIIALMRLIADRAQQLADGAGQFQPGQHPKNLRRMRKDAITALHAVSLACSLYGLEE